MSKKQKINNFIKELTNEFGIIPKFAHNKKQFDGKVFYSGPFFNDEEMFAIIESLVFGKWISSGESVHKFEIEFSKKFNVGNSLMVNSGSSANLVMIAALKKYFKWGDDDEIIISVVGFPTTLSPVIINKLKPVFIDIELDTLNFDVNLIENKITNKTKAIFISPVLANPPNMDFLIKLKEKYNIKLILDNCDSLGSTWNKKYLTNYVIASSCSFYPAHHCSTLEGGMVSSQIKEVVDIARSTATWGRDCYCVGSANLLPNGTCQKRFCNWLNPMYDGLVDHKYVFTNIGYNLKPLDLQGAVGRVQLKKFDEIYQKRRQHKEKIEKIFSKIKGIQQVKVYDEANVSWFGVPIICETKELKDKLVKHLENNKIQTRNYFAGNILIHPAYKECGNWKDYPNANEVLRRVFFVGCSPHYDGDTINYIEKIIKDFICLV